ncbi:MAG TPA: branched-chain amino acid ABC transporter substrate-binding protein [Deltaproteobacteria bacterium]|jgi:branched-chain amino acid transport system substrate-binding protein|nr:branched-chain amino acid ABC transporter substrate-binding protein [Deltaproteobacteria bacterium]
MKRLICSLVAVFMVLCAGWAYAAEPIKLGVAGAHSGELRSYGLPSLEAAKLVVSDINARGGILGRKVVIVEGDDACKPEVAANVASKLATDGVVAVLGHICSGATKTGLGIYRDANIITMSPSATNTDLTLSGAYPNFFRTIGSDDYQAKIITDFALKKLKLKTFAVIHDKADYGKDVAESAKKYLESKGARVVLFEGITPGAVDYSAIVQKIKRSNAQMVIYGGYHPEAAKIVMGMRNKKMKTLFISDDGVKDDTFIKVAGRYAEGVYATGPADTSKNRMAIAASEQHKKVYGSDPGAFYLNAYAAALCLLQAIDKAGSTDYAAVSKALRSNWFDTPLGKISFDKNGDAKGIDFTVYQVQKGKYVELGK